MLDRRVVEIMQPGLEWLALGLVGADWVGTRRDLLELGVDLRSKRAGVSVMAFLLGRTGRRPCHSSDREPTGFVTRTEARPQAGGPAQAATWSADLATDIGQRRPKQ